MVLGPQALHTQLAQPQDKKGDHATLHETVELELYQWAWQSHALRRKKTDVLFQLRNTLQCL